MAMPSRTHSSPSYRYGFNGKEKDESGEWGDLTAYDYGFRIYNPGIARFLSVDPLTATYPWYTPYQFAGNKPIVAVDLDGLEEVTVHSAYWTKKLQELVWNGATGEEIRQAAESYNCHGGGLYGGYQNAESREWAEKHYESAGYVTSVSDGHLSITGFSNANDGSVYRIILTPSVTIQDGPSQSPSGFEGVLERMGEIRRGAKDYLGDDDSDFTMDEALPIMYGTASVVGGILTLGAATEAQAIIVGGYTLLTTEAAVSFAIFNGGGSVLFGLDGMTTIDGETYIERVWITDSELQAVYNGTKTIHSITDTFGSGVSLVKGEVEAAIGLLNSLISIPDNAKKTVEDANTKEDGSK